MEIPDRGGEGGRWGLSAEIMQEVPEAGKEKKVEKPAPRPRLRSSHPGKPSWGDLGFPRHCSEHPVSQPGHPHKLGGETQADPEGQCSLISVIQSCFWSTCVIVMLAEYL